MKLSPLPLLIACTLVGLAPAVSALAHVYVMPEELLSREFQGATVERRPVYLSREQQAALSREPGLERVGRFFTFYVAKSNGAVVGYGVFDTHRVRTKEETLFVALTPEGRVRRVEVVSFFEPEEYLAPRRWLDLLAGKTAADAFQAGRDLPAITGATLTTGAIGRTVKKVLAIHRLQLTGD